MGADKNSSRERTQPIPQIHNQGFPHEFAKVSSHSGPTNPRNKLQTISKRKHNSRSKGLSNTAQCQADGPRAWGGRSADTGRTIRYPWADGPLIATERLNAHPETRTVHKQLVLRGQSAIPRRTVWPARGRSSTLTGTVRQTTCSKPLTPRKIYARANKN
jgi:hypothetical protein